MRLLRCTLLTLVGGAVAGCNGGGPDFVGLWSGGVTCGGASADVELLLEKQERGVFIGPLDMHFERTPNATDRIVTNVRYDAKLRAQEDEAQDLDFQVDYQSTACEGYRNGTLQTEDCAILNVDTAELEANEAALETAAWDGLESITIETAICTGTLQLQPSS